MGRMEQQSKALAALAIVLALVACAGTSAQQLVPVVDGLDRPVGVTNAGDGTGRLFVIEQAGRIRIVNDGELVAEPFLDIRDRVESGGERGLLGLAFPSDYEESGRFYVTYNDTFGATIVSRFAVGNDPNRSDPRSEERILRQTQPHANHNGGHVAFGPNGYLYIGLGDGGGQGDPTESGQDPTTWLGTILRIDVSTLNGYAVPPDNPFVGDGDALPEIWAWGLRNPWRFSFDRQTGDLWIGDVGEDRYEEIDMEPASSAGGVNYGWNVMEGPACFDPPEGCDREGLTPPVVSYHRDTGWGRSVTGGYVYRGRDLPELVGAYIFGDYVSGVILRADRAPDGSWSASELFSTDLGIVSFGEDEAGELYVVDVFDGAIHRLAPE